MKKTDSLEKQWKQNNLEKDKSIEEAKADFRKKLAGEKKKYEQIIESQKKTKEEIDKKHALIIQDVPNHISFS